MKNKMHNKPCIFVVAVVCAVGAWRPLLHAGESVLPLQAERKVSFETEEGTWLSMDVSPDGNTLIFGLLGDLYTLDINGGRAKALTTGMAFDAEPVFSPDGKKIAFISDRNGSENLWIADADGNNARPLSSETQMQRFASPAWSSGSDAVYVARSSAEAFAPSRLWLYHVAGGKGREITAGSAAASWQGAAWFMAPAPGAEGRYLYYSTASNLLSAFPWKIERLDLLSGQREQILDVVGGAMRPVISPDGHNLVYATRYQGNTELRLRDLQNGSDRRLLYPIEADMMTRAFPRRGNVPGYTFTPDGRQIIIAYGGKIRRIEIGSGKAAVIPFKTKVDLDIGPDLRWGQKESSDPIRARIIQASSLSPDGKTLIFSAFGKLYHMPAHGGKPQRLTTSPMKQGAATENQPAWSPDGRYIAYVTWTPEGGHIWKVKATGNARPKRLTNTPAFYRKPTFTPDGKAIVALRSSTYDRRMFIDVTSDYGEMGERSYRQQLVRVSTNGGQVSPVAALPKLTGVANMYFPGTGQPHFGNNSSEVYVYNQSGLSAISLTDGRVTPVVQIKAPSRLYPHTPVAVDDVRLSPDGDWALVLHNSELYLLAVPSMAAPGATIDLSNPDFAKKRLADMGASFFEWADNGRSIAWSVGSTFYKIPFNDTVFKQNKPNTGGFIEDALSAVDIAVEVPRDMPSGTIVLRGGRAVTMRGNEIIDNADIVVSGNRIVALGAHGQVDIPKGASVRDISGKTVTPGFIDTHAHWFTLRRGVIEYGDWALEANLAYGITAGLDVQAFTHDTFIYQDLVDAGLLKGTRAYNVGKGIFGTHNFVSRQHALRVLSRYKKHYRTNNIKAYTSGNRLQRQYVIQAAKELDLMPTTEAMGETKLNLTHVQDGFAGIEHALTTQVIYNDVLELLVQTGISYTPTLLPSTEAKEYFFSRQNPLNNDKLKRLVPEQYLDKLARRRGEWWHDSEFVFADVAKSAGKVFRAGGLVGIGSHGELQGLGYHWELQALAAGGLSPHEVLQVATRSSAQVIGRLPDMGTLEPGKYADLIIFNQNPLTNIRHTENIDTVMKGGRLYRGDDLEQIWPAHQKLYPTSN